MAYLVFARKWRPKDFDEIVGQEHVSTTLKNAISSGRLAHAYLFCGPRGIGKTSTARILAKALNCEKGTTIKSCNKCPSCIEISEARNIDVIEIDGASNRGIDEIRNLRENVKCAPLHGRFKIYIIDEVHMLTQEAFNALLKTLEEPPAHVKFIFATTRPHKVLATILSRCQRFDFRNLSVADITAKLKKIAKQEKVHTEEGALLYIARIANGSMRDAETLLDQIIAYSRGKINFQTVSTILGIVDTDELCAITDLTFAHETAGVLKFIDNLTKTGKDLIQFLEALVGHFRNLLIAKSAKDATKLIDLPAEDIEKIKRQAQRLSLQDIFYVLQILLRVQESIRFYSAPRIPLEITLIKLAQRDNLVSLEEILAKLENLEKNLPDYPPAVDEKAEEKQTEPPAVVKSEIPQPEIQEPPPAAKQEQAVSPEAGPVTVAFEEILKHWGDLVSEVKKQRMSIGSYLAEGRPKKLEGDVLTVSFPLEANFHREVLATVENRAMVEEKLAHLLDGRHLNIEFVVDADQKNSDSFVQETQKKINPDAHSEPFIHSAINLFKGKLIKHEEH